MIKYIFLISLAFLSACTTKPLQTSQKLSTDGEETIHMPHDGTFGPFATVSKKCVLENFAKITLITPPKHGTTRIFMKTGDIVFDKTSEFAHCNNKQVKGEYLEYKRPENFIGNDFISFSVLFKDGEKRIKNVHFDLK